MLIEQALFSLPEVLTGGGYPKQDYEGGIVAALGQSLLQELNGRNAVNPLSHLIAERLYLKTGFAGANGKKRYLRADLHLNLKPLRLGTKRLSGFGWRHSNWIEAKFFRQGEQFEHMLEVLWPIDRGQNSGIHILHTKRNPIKP